MAVTLSPPEQTILSLKLRLKQVCEVCQTHDNIIKCWSSQGEVGYKTCRIHIQMCVQLRDGRRLSWWNRVFRKKHTHGVTNLFTFSIKCKLNTLYESMPFNIYIYGIGSFIYNSR